MQKPTVGRIVHYQSHGSPNGQHKSEPRAAIVTAVSPVEPISGGPVLSLCVLNPTGMYFNVSVPYSEEREVGCWSWPPRES